ncbi:MAG: IS630 family transposase [Actinobacteria bacterium]|nr:IS630 family transposase [Actinomycetota bacterium]
MRLAPLKLRRGDRKKLEAWTRAGTVEARVAQRARIVLLAADGVSNREIAARVGLHYNQVGTWRSRYAEFGLAGLDDIERPGRPPVYDHNDVLLLVKLVTEPPPDSATRWTMELLAQAMAEHGVPISPSQAWRICAGLDLKPWQTESWMTSHDPDFWEKAGDVCGLYLNPPENAVVWSVDEKSGMQAKSRINPTKPAIPGKRVRREFEYRRNGTAVLFAALNVHEGDVAGWVTDSTRSENFVEFLTDLVRYTPNGLELHCIVDNLSAHGTPLVENFLDEHPHVYLHNTPTHASWLNQVELFFSILQRRVLRSGEFASTDELADRVIAFIKDYNRKAKPFRWTYDGRPLKVA